MNGFEHVTSTDWKFDFASLPRWDNRKCFLDAYDNYFEIPQSDTLCCLYSICEVSMGNYLGFLAVLKNKEDPRLVLSSDINFCVNFSVDSTGRLIFLQPSLYDRTTDRKKRPILILDIESNRFSYLRTDNLCPAYKVIERKKYVFVIEADEFQRKNNKELNALHGKKIRTKWLKWYDMRQLDSLHDMICGE